MRLRLFLAFLVLLLVPAASAMASGKQLLRDACDDEVVNGTYTQKEYREALSELATDSSEYSDCENVIRRAQLAAAAGPKRNRSSGGGTSNGGGGGSTGSSSSGGGGSSSGGAGSSSSSGSSSSGGSQDSGAQSQPQDPLATATPEEQQALAEARTGGGRGTDGVVPPGSSRAPNLSRSSDLPSPVTGLLILLAGALVIVTGARTWTRVQGRRTA